MSFMDWVLFVLGSIIFIGVGYGLWLYFVEGLEETRDWWHSGKK